MCLTITANVSHHALRPYIQSERRAVLCRSRTERDATNWSSDKLKSLLLGLTVENEEGACEVTEVGKVEGEASINNRKGKLIFFYEWTLKATWTGS